MNDHRIVMAAAIAATACDRPVCIKGCDAVNKSWPLFFDTFAALGNRVSFS
jgi:3-phosphoshikimate 1-carboxyvinyltransferase